MAIINTWVVALSYKNEYNPTPKNTRKRQDVLLLKGGGWLKINSCIYMHQVLFFCELKIKEKRINVFKPGFETWNPKQ